MQLLSSNLCGLNLFSNANVVNMEEGHSQASTEGQRRESFTTSYWGDTEKKIVTIYEIAAGCVAVVAMAALVEGVLLKEPSFIAIGALSTFIAGGGTVLAHKYRELKDLNEVTEALQSEVTRLRAENQKLNALNRDVQQQLVQLGTNNKELKESIEANNKDFKESNQKLVDQNQQLEASNRSFQAQVEKLGATEKALQEDIQGLDQQVLVFKNENEKLQGLNQQLETDVSDLGKVSTQINVSAQDIVGNVKSLELMKSEYEKLERKLTDVQNRLGEAQQKEAQIDAERERLAIEHEQKEIELVKSLSDLLKYQQLIEAIKKIAPEAVKKAQFQVG